MARHRLSGLGAALAVALAPGLVCAEPPASPDAVVSERGLPKHVTIDRLPTPTAQRLLEGRAIWAETCHLCHGSKGLTGAPKITSAKAWRPRIAQGLDTLFRRAIEGFLGPRFTEMPARGGDADLTDDQVKSAVAFMVWTSGGQAEVERWLDSQKDN